MADKLAGDAWVIRALKVALPAGGTGLSLVKLGQARLAWGGVRGRALADIETVRAAVAAEFADDDEQQSALNAALTRIGGLAAHFNATLEDQLDAVLNAQERARPQLANAARATLSDYVTFLESDALMAAIDGNEITPQVQIAAPMRRALSDVAAALG